MPFKLLEMYQMESLRSSVNEQLKSVGEEILCVLEKQNDVWQLKPLVRVLVSERLTAAAELICELFQREIETLQTLLETQRTLMDSTTHTADFLHLPVCTEYSAEQQERGTRMVQKDHTDHTIHSTEEEEILLNIQSDAAMQKNKSGETDRAVLATVTRSARQRRPAENKSTNAQYGENMSKGPSISKRTMAQYRETMEAKAKSNGYTSWLVLLLLLLGSAALLTYNKFPALYQNADDGEHTSRSMHTSRSVTLDGFASRLSALEAQFPSQRAELWKRSRIHLSKHLQTYPTEPVSLILTAGRKAEKTLHCLAGGLASAFSSAFNASVLHIDGASKAHLDSDQVKLDIDNQLRGAFEGDKPVAVIHRFEELPPGSTLIFCRYCDHETAAYKQVFLAFTVLLPREEVPEQKSLKDVEEMVHDYINQRFLGTDEQTAFNKMDVDKLSGLWSRISHLILPVEAEDVVERKGCQ